MDIFELISGGDSPEDHYENEDDEYEDDEYEDDEYEDDDEGDNIYAEDDEWNDGDDLDSGEDSLYDWADTDSEEDELDSQDDNYAEDDAWNGQEDSENEDDELFPSEHAMDDLLQKAFGIERPQGGFSSHSIMFTGRKICATRHGCKGAANCDYAYGSPAGS